MNDHDLERRLRSETGPREDGYRAVPLPEDPGSKAGAPRRSRMLQAGLVLATVGTGVLAIAAASALLMPGTPNGGVGSETTPTPDASASTAAATACHAEDVELSAEPWGGAAGSRGTVVTIRLASGRSPCLLSPEPAGQMTDANGVSLAGSQVEPVEPSVLLGATDAPTVGVAWSNYCGEDVAEPVRLDIVSYVYVLPVDVPGTLNPLPPCNGPGAPSVVSTTELMPGG